MGEQVRRAQMFLHLFPVPAAQLQAAQQLRNVWQIVRTVDLLRPAFFTMEEVPAFLAASVKGLDGGSETARSVIQPNNCSSHLGLIRCLTLIVRAIAHCQIRTVAARIGDSHKIVHMMGDFWAFLRFVSDGQMHMGSGAASPGHGLPG